ncbi:MAG: hypothetical protein INR62_13250, partial [Rhodospirillales bacterium]|nr:hypothetical protein [Acetobacter sp.]
ALHAHAPFQNLTDNMLVGNTVVNNGADYQDASTPGPTGVNIYSATPQAGNMVVNNHISGESYGVGVKVPAVPVQVQYNSLTVSGPGVANFGVGPVIATENWWGCPSGPGVSGSGCASAFGMGVVSTPWLTSPVPGQPSF